MPELPPAPGTPPLPADHVEDDRGEHADLDYHVCRK
jgi:hypothetical protein